METRLIIAYALIVLIAAAVAVGGWLLATRHARTRKRERTARDRWRKSRADANLAGASGEEE